MDSQTRSKRFGAGALLLASLASAGMAAGGVWLALRPAGAPQEAVAEKAKDQYVCPMHPQIVDDHASDCPICGMKLVKVETPAPGGAKKEAPKKDQFVCPMHPQIVDDHASDCPICGMKLVKVQPAPGGEKKEAQGKDLYVCPMHPQIVDDHASDCPICGMKLVKVEGGAGGDAGSGVQGLATVDIDPARQQLIGLKTAEVVAGTIGGAWRTVGRVAMDETKVQHVNVKIAGYVEKIHVDFVGKMVRKGEPLFSYYSPELFAAQQEYLLALRTRESLAKAGGMAGDGDALVAAARRKLSLWDIPESEIERIGRSGEPSKTLTLVSPANGVVFKKDVVEGMKLDAGAMPYEIVDLSTVWVLADVYESDLRHVKEGMAATLTLNAFPDREFKGKILFIDPLLDPQTRTVKVRLAFPNPTGDLRPEMFGEVVIHGKPREGLRIPQDAVIDSGTEKIVFVAAGEGKFQPRKIQLGATDGNSVEVVSGLHAGEKVVTRANFLVDSESRLRASLAEMASESKGAPERARVLPDSSAPQEGQQHAPGHSGH